MEPYEDMTKEELIKALSNYENTLHELKAHQIEVETKNIELQEKQRELEESRNRYALLYDFAPVGYCTLDEKGIIRKINLTGATILGVEREQLPGMPFSVFVSEGDMEKFFSHLKKCKEHIEKVSTELCLKEKDGHITWIEILSSPIEGSEELMFHTVITDITERKRSEEELISSKTILNTILDSIPDIIGIQNIDHTILRYNRAGYEFLHLTPEDVHGRLCYELIGRNIFCEDCATEKALKTKKIEHVERYLIEYDIYLDCYSIPVLNKDGEIVFIVEQLCNITSRKRAEEELRESKEKYCTIFDQSPIAIEFYDSYGSLINVNSACINLFGVVNINEISGFKLFEDPNISNDIKTKILNNENVRFESEFNFEEVKRLNLYQTTCSGIKNLDWSITPLTNGNLVVGYILQIQDITGRKKAEEEQKKLQDQLTQAQKMESVGRLVGGIAHNYNNMLCIIISCVELAMCEIDSKEFIIANLEKIRKAANRSADITRQLMAFASKQIVLPKVLDLNETVEGMLNILRQLIGEDVDIVWKAASELCSVKIDSTQIDQILTNLLVNARDAIAGVGKVNIETAHIIFDEAYCATHTDFMPGEYIMLSVSDNGHGMSQETLANIFEPFFTTKELYKGSGLGLASVYGTVKQNNGFIKVYSESGKGTTFKIYLPRYLGKTTMTSEKEPVETATGGMETVLIVEDEMMLMEPAKALLKKIGYTVLTAATPGEALRLAREHTREIHLLITDVVMPEMNGCDLAKQLLSLRPNLKCLFMSGYTENVIAHHGIFDKRMNFIQKPFSRKDLFVKVRKVMEQK
jgi:PAS domain S-box-containing protein